MYTLSHTVIDCFQRPSWFHRRLLIVSNSFFSILPEFLYTYVIPSLFCKVIYIYIFFLFLFSSCLLLFSPSKIICICFFSSFLPCLVYDIYVVSFSRTSLFIYSTTFLLFNSLNSIFLLVFYCHVINCNTYAA